ncbi:MAG: hypothetical protein Kilf2KO_02030 [Rhodospirillales bacterium]
MILGGEPVRRLLTAGLLSLVPGIAVGQQLTPDENRTVNVNYVYASQLGIGTYDVGGLSVNVYTLPFAIDRSLDGLFGLEVPFDNAEDWTISLKFPVSYGIFDFSAFDSTVGQIDITQRTLSLVPGLALDIPIEEHWRLRPTVNFGVGGVVDSSGPGADDNNVFMIYSAGLSSLYEIPSGPYTFALGNGFTFAGNRDFGEDGFKENYWAIETGVQLRRTLGFTLGDIGLSGTSFADVEPEIGPYFIHYYFPDPLVFSRFGESPLEVDNQYEFGVSFGSATDWDLLFLKNPELGASYIFGDGLKVVRVNFGFPF